MGRMPVQRAGWNAHGTCWVECPRNVLGGMPIECALWNLAGDTNLRVGVSEWSVHVNACQLAGRMPAACGAHNDESGIVMRDGTIGQ